jgi:hypothetical protein
VAHILDQDLDILLEGSQEVELFFLFQSSFWKHILIDILVGYPNWDVSLGCGICKHSFVLSYGMKAIPSHL